MLKLGKKRRLALASQALAASLLIAIGMASPLPAHAQGGLPTLGDGSDLTSSEERRLGDRIIRELYRDPDNLFVAGFIGAPEMNIRPSQLVEHGGRLHLTLGDQRLPLNDRLQSKVETHKNQQVFFGVRPEFVSLSDEPFAEGSCAGEMVRVENMGHEFFVYLRVADYELTARVPSDDAKPMIAKGLNRKVYFTFDLNKCHIFDAKTEQNLSL